MLHGSKLRGAIGAAGDRRSLRSGNDRRRESTSGWRECLMDSGSVRGLLDAVGR